MRERLLAVAWRMLSNVDDAEDAVQETMLKLWDMRSVLVQVRSVAALSVTITKNNCRNRLKLNKRRAGDGVAELLPDTLETPLAKLERFDTFDRTMTIIGTLPEMQQAILRMKHIDMLEVAEIAELTASTPEAVRMNLSRARRRVRELFMKGER